MWVGEDGRLYGMNPEFGVFGVAKDTNENTNPTALDAIAPGTRAIFTNVAYNTKTQEVWFEGKTPNPPEDLDGWLDWKGNPIAGRSDAEKDDPWAHPNSRFTTTLANVPNIADDYETPVGVPIDGIIFGGRTRDREPLIRAIRDVAEGVYDGLTLGARRPSRPTASTGSFATTRCPCARSCPTRRARTPSTGSTSSTRPPTSRSSPTSTGSSGTRATATSCGPATATTCARCCGSCSCATGKSPGSSRRSASCRPRPS